MGLRQTSGLFCSYNLLARAGQAANFESSGKSYSENGRHARGNSHLSCLSLQTRDKLPIRDNGSIAMGTGKRSPNFPFISLEKAIYRAEEFYHANLLARANAGVAVEVWGYAAKSSGGQQTIAALVAYGLLEEEGSGPSRKLWLSPLGKAIVLDERPGSEDRKTAIREAAKNPRIFNELLEIYSETGIPSDPHIKHTLQSEYHFPPKKVVEFIKIFRQTIDFAGINGRSEEMEERPSRSDVTREEVFRGEMVPARTSASVVQRPEPAGMKQDTIDLDEGLAVLQWPANISMESLQEIKDWLSFQIRRMEQRAKRSAQVEDDE